MDLFGDDDEDAGAAKPALSRAEQIEKMKADKAAAEKANKKRDRSQIVLEVKPTDTEVNLDDLYATIKKEICPSGLTWGEGYNKAPVVRHFFVSLSRWVSVCLARRAYGLHPPPLSFLLSTLLSLSCPLAP